VTKKSIDKAKILLLLQNRDCDDFSETQLCEWMEHNDSDVRDWATFTLGTQTEEDSENIRLALLKRTHDVNFDTVSEAFFGLARRRDRRAIPILVDRLYSDHVSELEVQAAGIFADKSLVAPLELLLDWWDVDSDLLKRALKRCNGESVADADLKDWVVSNDE
jgi:HEAT repeat protein